MQPLSLPTPLGQSKIYLYSQNVDMRKSFDGLHAIVQSEFQRDIRLGDLFLFLNRRLDRIKLLHWDRDGLVIWMKRLERGSFQRPRCAPGAAHVESVQQHHIAWGVGRWRGGEAIAGCGRRGGGGPR